MSQWSEIYLGLAWVLGTINVVVWLDVWPFRIIPAVGWLAISVLTMAVTAMWHHFQTVTMKLGEGDEPPEIE